MKTSHARGILISSIARARRPLLSLVFEPKSREDFPCKSHFDLQRCVPMHSKIAIVKSFCDTSIRFRCPVRRHLAAHERMAGDHVHVIGHSFSTSKMVTKQVLHTM